MTIEDSAFLKHELESIDPLQLTSKQRQRQKRKCPEQPQEDQEPVGPNHGNGCKDVHGKPSDGEPSSWYDWDKNDIWLEARLFLELAGVSSLMNLGFISSPLLTASYVGRSFSPVYLSAFTLANLTGNLCTFSIMAGLFSASDTLSPQAFGRGDFAEVGRIAIRGFAVASTLLLPINVVLFYYLESIMIALGQNAEASMYASQWYKVFVFNLPFSVLFNCLWKFLTAQHIMKPLILVSILCTCVILPLSLEICIHTMGFVGSAVGYVIFQASQAIALLFYVYWKQPHEAGTWPGLSREIVASALDWNQMKEFLHLGLGGIVAQCEWVFWEAIGLIVGRLGVVALSVHTIPNQTIMAFCMVPFSFGIALAIRMGNSLPLSVRRTQVFVLSILLFSTILFGLVTIVVYVYRDAIVGLFTTDESVKELADVIWLKVSLFNLNIAIFGIMVGIATGLGKQWSLGVINFVFLWLFGLPMIYYTAIVRDKGLDAAWFWMNIPYLCMNVTLFVMFVFTDWHQIQEQILLAGEKKNTEDNDDNDDQQGGPAVANERTSLL
jgi:MATE family multidrug resistance protein